MGSIYTKPYTDYYDLKAENLFLKVGEEIEFFKFAFENNAKIKITKILDVGCGTGRHYIPLTQAGYEVTGLDPSENMLNKLRIKLEKGNIGPRIIVKDMREIDFDAQFDAIICMNSAFLYLLTDDDILKTLKAFQRALNNGGLVIMDIMNFLSLFGRYREEVVGRQIKDGVVCETAIKHSIEDVPAIWNHDEFGIINDNGKEITYHERHRLRISTYNEMRRFLSDAGFREIKCFGDFNDREEAKANARRLIFVAVR